MVVAQRELEQAKALAGQGNSQAAIALLSKLIQRDTGNVEAWLALADVVEEPDRVEFCLRKVLNLDPGNATALEKLSKTKGGSFSVGWASGMSSDKDEPGEDLIQGAARVAQREQVAGDEYQDASAAVEPESGQRLPDAPETDDAILAPDQASHGAAGEPAATADRATKPEAAPTAQDELTQGGKPRRSFSRTHLILIGLTLFAGLVLCSLVGAAVVSNSSLFSSQPADSQDEVVQVVFENVIAANREDLGAYMATIHPDSSEYATTQATIQSAFSLYDLSYEIFIPEMIEQDKSEAIISFVLTTRKVQGPAFQNNTVTGEMSLRKHEGEWMIYDRRVDSIQYLS